MKFQNIGKSDIKDFLISIALFAGIVAIVVFLGSKFSAWYAQKYEDRIFKNGKSVYGTILRHGYNKGDYIKVAYQFGIQRYEYKEWDDEYQKFPDGTRIVLMVDSTCPEDAIIIGLRADSGQNIFNESIR